MKAASNRYKMGNCCESLPPNRAIHGDEAWEDHSDGSVFLNVYDLNDSMVTCNWVTSNLIQLGGAFHAGVEVYQSEWSYGTEGIFKVVPRNHEYHVFNQSVPMGRTRLDPPEVQAILREMAPIWKAVSYDLIRKNCCTFADAFCKRLGVEPLPGWVNRLAQVGAGALLAVQHVAVSLGPAGTECIVPDEDGYELLEGSGNPQSPQLSVLSISVQPSSVGSSPDSASSPQSVEYSKTPIKYNAETPIKYNVEDC